MKGKEWEQSYHKFVDGSFQMFIKDQEIHCDKIKNVDLSSDVIEYQGGFTYIDLSEED